jgi:hypothetical protein
MTRRELYVGIGGLLAMLGFGKMFGIKFPISLTDGDGSHEHPWTDKLAHGLLDEVWSSRLYARQQVVKMIRGAFPGFSTCGRCEFPWCLVQGRSVDWSASSGTFALCRDCWDELQIAEYRIPYYHQANQMQHDQWLAYKHIHPDSEDPLSHWEALKKGVEEESAREDGFRHSMRIWQVPRENNNDASVDERPKT